MKKFFLILFLLLAFLYGVLHIVLGSSPLQKRVVAELQDVLKEYGVSLEMESIEFSAFAPKIYLNRVKLGFSAKSGIVLGEPLSVDKIKIVFSPLGLLWRKIEIDELLLFHPKISIPRADKLYQSFVGLLASKGAIKFDRPSYDVVLHKAGVVDSFFDIKSVEPPFAIRSRSLTILVEKGSGQNRSVVVQSTNLEGAWDKIPVALNKIDIDLDLASDSLRLNQGVIENEHASVNLVGVSRFPEKSERVPKNLSVSYEFKVKLPYLSTWGLSGLAGSVSSQGTVKKEGEVFSGKGSVGYEGVTYKGYEIGTGLIPFELDKRYVNLNGASLKYASGEFKTSKVRIELSDHLPVSGELAYQSLLLDKVLAAVGVEGVPVRMESGGKMKLSGTLMEPFALTATLDSQFKDLSVLDEASERTALIEFGNGTLKGPLTFSLDKMDFDAVASVLEGEVKAKGFVGFDDRSSVQAEGTDLSLTRLSRISALELGGKANLKAEVVVEKEGGHVSGSFDVTEGKVANLELGAVSGEAFYQSGLLTFENLILPSLEPVRGNGFVDFSGDETKYKFYVNARRTETNKIFQVMRNLKMNFEIPKEGEVSSRISIEGGGSGGVTVSASGQAKNFSWFDERWLSSAYSLTYSDSTIDLHRVMLTKPSGVLEVRGRFGKTSRLSLSTYGLQLGGFDRFGKAPVSGELVGQLLFEGPPDRFLRKGSGEVKLIKAKFRGMSIPDSTVKVRPLNDNLEYVFSTGNERLRGRFVRAGAGEKGALEVTFKDFDFAPLLTLALSRDIPPMNDLKATGDLSLSGDFDSFGSLTGSGSINALTVGFDGTPMRAERPAKITMDKKGLRVESLLLKGEDSQVGLAVNFESDRKLEARLDGRIDLQYLQPFIPGLEYGSGKVSAGLRISGHPSKYQLLGNASLEEGTFRLSGFTDEFRSVNARFSFSQDRINIDRFQSAMNGGTVVVDGDLRLDRFRALTPNLRIRAENAQMHLDESLFATVSADLTLRGKSRPYLISGTCNIHQGTLLKFQGKSVSTALVKADPLFAFDVQCPEAQKMGVSTDTIQAEFKGSLHLVGNNVDPGLLGSVEAVKGSLLFRDTKFNLDSASVKFESPTEIFPRFRVAGRANVREVSQGVASGQSAAGSNFNDVQNYEISLQTFGTPNDYKIRLSSTPPLLEGEIISLLVLGVTKRGQQSGNLLDLGSALVGQIPIQSKLKKDLGVNIKINSQSAASLQQGTNLSPGSANTDITAPTVQIQKTITDKTKLSFSNSLETIPVRELRLEQMLDDNVTLNATTMERTRGAQTQPTQAYGLDFRYRFQFE
jgi:translocation and assembly module TamB